MSKKIIEKQKNYGSIPHMTGSTKNNNRDKGLNLGQEKLLTVKRKSEKDTVIVTEKVDGTNVGIWKIDYKLYVANRYGYDVRTSSYNVHHMFYDYAMKNKEKFLNMLKNNEKLVGEWMVKTHGLEYDLPHEPFIAIDIKSTKNNYYKMPYRDFLKRCKEHNVTHAKVIHIGEAISVQESMALLGDNGFHGCLNKPEGVVYRYENSEGVVAFLAKYVREGMECGKYMKDESKYNTYKDY